jgi:hypothetical protein
MEKETHTFLVSLWASVGGLVLGGFLACLMYFWSTFGFYIVLLAIFGIEISGVTAAIRELRHKLNKPVLILWIVSVLLAPVLILAIIFKLGNFQSEDELIFPILYGIVVAVMGVIAGHKSVSIKIGQTKGLWTVLILWLMPLALSPPLLMSPTRTSIAFSGTFFPLLGPWATHAVKIVNFPNAGAAFHLPTAMLLSAIIFAILLLLFLTKNKKMASLALILFMALIFSWYVIGFWQLAYCAV